ncbi:hypothetical protein MASR2M50_23970 [Thauera sp.]
MNKPEILSQQRRENPDPEEGRTPIPWLVLALALALAAFGVDYIAHSNLSAPATWGDGRSAAELAGDKPAAGAKVDGGAIFNSMCAACHQATGLGLPGVFPPLAGSEWVLGKPDTLAAILLHGVSGPLEVKGTVYQGVMPVFGGSLSDAEIAAVLTHIRSSWGNAAAPIDAEAVAAARARLADRKQPFSGGDELATLP